jgi:hypothetical protein
VLALEFSGRRPRAGALLADGELEEVMLGGCRQEKSCLFSRWVEMLRAKA